ncbi:hypothetical protein MTP99_006211 [Tenebrio molitor]|nr:hypothetical protein MTP99_006211 [Tenebrio molitor]
MKLTTLLKGPKQATLSFSAATTPPPRAFYYLSNEIPSNPALTLVQTFSPRDRLDSRPRKICIPISRTSPLFVHPRKQHRIFLRPQLKPLRFPDDLRREQPI